MIEMVRLASRPAQDYWAKSLSVDVTVRRENRWTAAGATAARELVCSTDAPIAIGWDDSFASGFRGARKSWERSTLSPTCPVVVKCSCHVLTSELDVGVFGTCP